MSNHFPPEVQLSIICAAMSTQVAQKEGEIMAPSTSEHETTLKKIVDKENYQRSLDNLVREIETKRHNIVKLADTCVTLQERTQEFKVNSSISDSRTAYAISLYGKISNITWDYSAAPGHLAGCKTVDTLQPFLFNTP